MHIEFNTERQTLSVHRDDRTDLCPQQTVEILDAGGQVLAVVRYHPATPTYPGGSTLTIEVDDETGSVRVR